MESHPLNASGDFYVVKQSCITCMAPECQAPLLMGFDEKSRHCYFSRQPQGAGELERALRAVWSSCISALRYAGNDPLILRRLAEMGLASQCDHPLEEPIEEKLFEAVTFSWPLAPDEGLQSFMKYLRSKLVRHERDRSGPAVVGERSAEFEYRWHDIVLGVSVSVELLESGGALNLWLKGGQRRSYRGIAMQIDDLLKENPEAGNIRWFTLEDWVGAKNNWRTTPF